MAKRYSRRRRGCRADTTGLTVLYSTNPGSHPPRDEDRRPIRILPIHLHRLPNRPFSRRKNACIKERHVPGRHLVQVHRHILRQTSIILEKLEQLHEAIQYLQLDAIEMDWDYSPTTASLCYVVHDTPQASTEPFHGQYLGMAAAWEGDSMDGILEGSDSTGMAMEICEEEEVPSV